jgi:hypothetical protein
MGEPRRLRTLRSSTACCRKRFIFLYYLLNVTFAFWRSSEHISYDNPLSRNRTLWVSHRAILGPAFNADLEQFIRGHIRLLAAGPFSKRRKLLSSYSTITEASRLVFTKVLDWTLPQNQPKQSHNLTLYSLWSVLILSSHLHLCLLSAPGLQTKILYVFLFSSKNTTVLANHFLLRLITLITMCGVYVTRNFLQSSVHIFAPYYERGLIVFGFIKKTTSYEFEKHNYIFKYINI